jgi:hypothetical protein
MKIVSKRGKKTALKSIKSFSAPVVFYTNAIEHMRISSVEISTDEHVESLTDEHVEILNQCMIDEEIRSKEKVDQTRLLSTDNAQVGQKNSLSVILKSVKMK